jgi:hypothetical protein
MSVIFKDLRKTVKISLPSFPESEIEIYEDLLFGQMKSVSECSGSDMDRGILVLQHLIKDWNFVDEKNEKLKVDSETLSSFPLKDFTILMEKANSVFEEFSKKNKEPSKKQ